jgi:hypothetical protein
MKTIEVFIDESGEIRDAGRPMNVTGIVMVSASGDTSNQFHRALYQVAAESGLLAGVCDGGPSRIIHKNPPERYLPKRPRNGDGVGHQEKILGLIAHASETAADTGVELAAFSLIFPCNAKMPWRSLTGWEDHLLDRSYLERLKDALELLFFECPWLAAHLGGPCQVAVDLPTRSVSSALPGLTPKRCGEILWNSWGMKNDGECKGELRSCSLAPADGAEILTSVLARRHRSLPNSVTIMAARCVRLMDWESWVRDCPNSGARNNWEQKYLPPKQVHYLADLLANAVYRGPDGSAIHHADCVLPWYQRGYYLKVGEVDPWILGSRLFANGDRVGALRMLLREKAAMNSTDQANFFKCKSRDWFPQLSGAELRTLFEEARPKASRKRPMGALTEKTSGASLVPPLQTSDERLGPAPEPAKPATLNLLAKPRSLLPSAQTAIVRWRALLELAPTWTSRSLMDAIRATEHLPEPLCIRQFSKDNMIEFLLDFRSVEDVRAWVCSPVVMGGEAIMAQDATLPSSHRIGSNSPEDAP